MAVIDELKKYLRPDNAASVAEITPQGLAFFKRIKCDDGFSISVQCHEGAYCSPRNNMGPWFQAECGFPSEKEDLLMEYAESPNFPTDTVYGYVPLSVVAQVIEKHGGFFTTP